MPQIGVAPFHTVGLTFVWHGSIGGIESINQVLIRCEAITVVALGLGRLVNHRLERGFVPRGYHRPAYEGMRRAVHRRYDIDAVFLCLTKVYNSSSSTVSACAGVGAVLGSLSAAAFTQLITV